MSRKLTKWDLLENNESYKILIKYDNNESYILITVVFLFYSRIQIDKLNCIKNRKGITGSKPLPRKESPQSGREIKTKATLTTESTSGPVPVNLADSNRRRLVRQTETI